jgi:hypothetical protein
MSKIQAKIICDSITKLGTRITTFEVEYPRFIHSEVMTHRMFSRNASSSRAIPVSKVIDQVRNDPAKPIHIGKNQAGMVADVELSDFYKNFAIDIWYRAAGWASTFSEDLSKLGVHKQVCNRITEPFQNMKVLITATEYKNFFYLRNHKDAQPEIAELARLMQEEYEKNTPARLTGGQYHLPYITCKYENGVQSYWLDNETEISLDDAIKISCSCCAQVSYRKLDLSLEKARDIYSRLVESEPVHASPFEHVAKVPMCAGVVEAGHTHSAVGGGLWSGNFREWIQYRQLIPNNTVKG